ncbi:hypothetical protein [Spirosoma linguale]|uniref:Curlin associated repeat protein n=1 Tax=Spirosoma linguale (strain ATCC 33905 / DSM 74 / LMG 10896 / Claus 1) TaxID=504472 RepID=D2QPP6_SPILD|nr:hypothetical protein Slin_4727 [Spirosoma linguale DSM 74]
MRQCIALLFYLLLLTQVTVAQPTSEVFITQLTAATVTGSGRTNAALPNTGGNELIIQQAGNNNTVGVQNNGVGNQLQALQTNTEGSNNQIDLQLTGDNNNYKLTQDGSNNVFRLPNATTSNAQLEVTQEGNGNAISSQGNLTTTSVHVIIHQTGGMRIQLLPPN